MKCFKSAQHCFSVLDLYWQICIISNVKKWIGAYLIITHHQTTAECRLGNIHKVWKKYEQKKGTLHHKDKFFKKWSISQETSKASVF